MNTLGIDQDVRTLTFRVADPCGIQDFDFVQIAFSSAMTDL